MTLDIQQGKATHIPRHLAQSLQQGLKDAYAQNWHSNVENSNK